MFNVILDYWGSPFATQQFTRTLNYVWSKEVAYLQPNLCTKRWTQTIVSGTKTETTQAHRQLQGSSSFYYSRDNFPAPWTCLVWQVSSLPSKKKNTNSLGNWWFPWEHFKLSQSHATIRTNNLISSSPLLLPHTETFLYDKQRPKSRQLHILCLYCRKGSNGIWLVQNNKWMNETSCMPCTLAHVRPDTSINSNQVDGPGTLITETNWKSPGIFPFFIMQGCQNATRSALKLNYGQRNVINPRNRRTRGGRKASTSWMEFLLIINEQ